MSDKSTDGILSASRADDASDITSEMMADDTGRPDAEETLTEWGQSVQGCATQLKQAHKATVGTAQTVLAAANVSDLEEVETQLRLLQDAFVRWQNEWAVWEETVLRAVARLSSEIEARPDLRLDAPTIALWGEEGPVDIQADTVAEAVSSLLKHIHDYDRDKQDVLDELDQIRVSIVALYDDISEWMTEESPVMEALPRLEADEAEMTLAELRAAIEEAAAEQQELEGRYSQLRELALSRIATLIARLREFDVSTDTVVADNLTLGDLKSAVIAPLPSRQLVSLEHALDRLVNDEIMKAKTAPTTLATELQSEWSDDKLVDLLERLGKEGRDVEALLLLLSANAAHPRKRTIAFPRQAVGSLLRGVEQLAKADPFGLLNVLAPDFLNGWQAADHEAQAEMCLVMMAAQCGGGCRLPSGFLWQLPVEWPVAEMPSWNKVWQAALQDEVLPITASTQDQDWAEHLEQARSRAEQMFAREHGFFVRLNSLRSPRHQTMVSGEIMPDLVSRLRVLEEIDNSLQAANQEAAARLLAELQRLLTGKPVKAVRDGESVDAYEQALSEHALIETYETGALHAGIDDPDTFHRRTALRILQDCADGILDYGRALTGFWRTQLQLETSVTREALQAELAMLPEMTPLGQAASEEIVQHAGRELAEWNEATARSSASQQLVHELLSHASYALRLPRVVGRLTGTRLHWEGVIQPLLDDLAMPVDPGEAAAFLMENDAPNQVLLLTQYLPLDIQKGAQLLKRDCEREFENTEMEILRTGGSTEDVIEDRELGRWRLIRRELTARLAERRSAREADEQRVLARTRALRSSINDLDDHVFEARSSMPVDAYGLVEQGVNLARRATATEALFEAVETYLEEIRYRLEHQSWPLAALQDANAQLERTLAEESPPCDAEKKAEQVLELLERGELRQLGLNPNDVAASSVATRCDLLHNWLSVRELPAFLSEQLKVTERTAIQNLFRYFAKMVVMKRTRAPDGKPMAYEQPTIFSYWRLQYPKTAALDNDCVLIALPGQPPSSKDLQQLHRLLDEKEWLDYFFVCLFVPGCTPRIDQRLRSSFQDRGLVIIDERAILDMVLAEAQTNNPLGRLRPLMLNARAAEDVDVFKINVRVNSRNAIFVGRDALVERIASSGDNYALYGGRRIGKSSVLGAVEDRLKRRGVSVVSFSFEGCEDRSDDGSARDLAKYFDLDDEVRDAGSFRSAIQAHMDANPSLNVVLLVDEVDPYIIENTSRHVLIEALRSLSDRYGSRFRVVVAGFMSLHDCLRGRGPYSPSSDPWVRMLNDLGPVKNLRPASAEQIVREGFIGILGWEFENRAIPQRIVERTGGHPAFVQYFCLKLQERVGRRGNRLVGLGDVKAIFDDRHPEQSFIAYVRKTLKMNLDPIARFLIPWLAEESSEAQGFTLSQMRELANLSRSSIPQERLNRSLERLSVTGVVKARAPEVYEFSVPDYPLILSQLGETAHLAYLEDELEEYLKREDDGVNS